MQGLQNEDALKSEMFQFRGMPFQKTSSAKDEKTKQYIENINSNITKKKNKNEQQKK